VGCLKLLRSRWYSTRPSLNFPASSHFRSLGENSRGGVYNIVLFNRTHFFRLEKDIIDLCSTRFRFAPAPSSQIFPALKHFRVWWEKSGQGIERHYAQSSCKIIIRGAVARVPSEQIVKTFSFEIYFGCLRIYLKLSSIFFDKSLLFIGISSIETKSK
jgi:hypothetical protein